MGVVGPSHGAGASPSWLLVYINAHRIIRKHTNTDVAPHRKVFQNIELKETCMRITKSNLTRSNNKTYDNRSIEEIIKVF
jgi:hypothetical protein